MGQTNKCCSDIKLLQHEMLVLLKLFHDYCETNSIKYSMHGGTLLGAVREGGFIPWDDDLDITMERSEFNRLLQVMKIIPLPENLTFSDNQPIIKIIMQRLDKPAVWIDIFIWDYITEKKLLRKIKIWGIMFFQVFIRSPKLLKKTKAHGKYKGISYVMMCFISWFGCLFPYKMKLAWMKKFFQSFAGNKLFIHRANDQLCGINLVLPKNVVDTVIKIPFEKEKFYAFEKYDEILKSTYGNDYMTPIRYEVNHADTRLNIDKF